MKRLLIASLCTLLLMAASVGPAASDQFGGMPAYLSITGVVTEVEAYPDMEGWYFVRITDENGGPATILVTDATCFPFESEAAEGDTVTAYYPAMGIMPLIYPPQYTADVLVVGAPEEDEIVFVAVDRFSAAEDSADGMLLSQDGMLALHINEDVPITTADGEVFDGELDGQNLVVLYAITTRSIPAQTTPIAVIVLP